MKTIFGSAALALIFAAAGLATPVVAAPLPAPVPVIAAGIDDFGCMVRTMFMAGAAENAAKKATDQAARDKATKFSTDNYEIASFFMGKLSASNAASSKTRFDAEVSAMSKLDSELLTEQIAQCVSRAQSERAVFIRPLTGK